MFLCYIDESGTPDIPGNTSHYVLAGLSIPIWYWKKCENEITKIKKRYKLEASEIHSGWILRKYIEQSKIPNFQDLSYEERRYQVKKLRNTQLLEYQKNQKANLRKIRKNFSKTNPYIHLTYKERYNFIKEIAECISQWNYAYLFAECVDKIHFNPEKTSFSVDEQAFQQLISRFEQFLKRQQPKRSRSKTFGLLIHDKNETVAKKHTEMMRRFHKEGTIWTDIKHIVETPLFVDSQLTSMIQIADLCAYILRRYVENKEEELFNLIFKRADSKNGKIVGVRHFTKLSCNCKICKSHR